MSSLHADPLDTAAITGSITRSTCGAELVFIGVTRDTFEGRQVTRLEYEAYAPLAIAEMDRIEAEVAERWPGAVCAMVHRTGVVPCGEASVVIAVGAPHRDAAYEASRFAIEALKARVPIWKKEVYADGSAWKANATTPT